MPPFLSVVLWKYPCQARVEASQVNRWPLGPAEGSHRLSGEPFKSMECPLGQQTTLKSRYG